MNTNEYDDDNDNNERMMNTNSVLACLLAY